MPTSNLNIISFKSSFKQQKAVKAKAANITPVYITNLKNELYKSNKKLRQANSYKNRLRQPKEISAISDNVPSYVSSVRQKYEKNGKLSNPHKKYLNILGIPRVVKQGCSSCGKALDPL
jgi:hypothetical protein